MKPENIDVMKRGSVHFGVAVTSTSAAIEALAEDFDKMVGECRALGCVTICGSHLKDRIAPFQMPGYWAC
jgi:hypothetical protein